MTSFQINIYFQFMPTAIKWFTQLTRPNKVARENGRETKIPVLIPKDKSYNYVMYKRQLF